MSDLETLIHWIEACLVIAAVCTTAFPVLYAFFQWRSTRLGQLLMFQAVAFAIAMDATAIFHFWTPTNMLFLFWMNVVVFTLIAASTFSLTLMLWLTNRTKNDNQLDPQETKC